jgi:hypothetical protein
VVQFKASKAQKWQTLPTNLKYSAKRKIPFPKATDVFQLMKEYQSNSLTQAERKFWYPKPTPQNTEHFEEGKEQNEEPDAGWMTLHATETKIQQLQHFMFD